MTATNMRYQEDGTVIAIINGVERYSVTPTSRFWPDIQVEIDAGNLPVAYNTPPPNPIISFDVFEARFTAQEWDDATDYVYAVDTATGKPKRKALVQGLARAQARNSVDLLDPKTDAFLTLLVAGNVITTAKKTKILEP